MVKHFIEVKNIEVYAHHGCLDEEGKIGQKYFVDVVIGTNFTKATDTDELSDTIDYVVINRIVEDKMAVRHHLIETVGQSIVDELKNRYPQIMEIHVKVIKPCPPINGNVEHVAIEIKESY